MKKSKIFLYLLSFALLSGCSKYESVEHVNVINNVSSSVIPLAEALDNLEEVSYSIYGKTKSVIKDVKVTSFGGIKTKSGQSLPDTTLYIVNYGENDGFAVLSAQRKMSTSVFCITENGKISVADLNEAYDKISRNSIVESSDTDEFESPGEEFVPMLIVSSAINQMYYDSDDSIQEPTTKSGYYYTHQKYGPFLETKWGQRKPFNTFRSDNAPTGCVATATAQILQFIKRGNPDNMNFSWEKLATVRNVKTPDYYGSSAAQKEASRFLEYIGLKQNCRIKYSANSSSGNSYGAKRTLKNFGYPTVKRYVGFNNNDQIRVRNSLSIGLPVYVDGNSGKNGHAWVIDGMWVRSKYQDSKFVKTESMYHVNWGWYGISDGYYEYGVFSKNSRVCIENGVDSGDIATDDFNYTWDFHTVIYSF